MKYEVSRELAYSLYKKEQLTSGVLNGTGKICELKASATKLRRESPKIDPVCKIQADSASIFTLCIPYPVTELIFALGVGLAREGAGR
jgi:hypothetical protein